MWPWLAPEHAGVAHATSPVRVNPGFRRDDDVSYGLRHGTRGVLVSQASPDTSAPLREWRSGKAATRASSGTNASTFPKRQCGQVRIPPHASAPVAMGRAVAGGATNVCSATSAFSPGRPWGSWKPGPAKSGTLAPFRSPPCDGSWRPAPQRWSGRRANGSHHLGVCRDLQVLNRSTPAVTL